ncbi:hypothetical protein [Geodermatophilus sp. CPCC 205761]
MPWRGTRRTTCKTYGHVVHITLEPLYDMDKAFESVINSMK